MSNIYIQEPATNGKVLLKTTVGDIDIELWPKEAPKAVRNFVQLSMEGYYDNTIFHRVVKDFIVQGGDPEGTGHGGESIYGYPFKDEFHSRLRFVRRGLVAMANAGPNDNGSQFFFTMASTPELSNKHTIFGKVGGNTIYNMLKLQEVDIGPNERPYFPVKIISADVLSSPFDDIVPRQLKRAKKEKVEEKKNKSQSKATKNFSLLSFGEEAEEDEVEVDKASKDMRGKSKSSHDLTDDPKLSAIPAIESEGEEKANEEDEQPDGSDIKSGKIEDSPQSKKRKLEEQEGEVPTKRKDLSLTDQNENVPEQKLSRSEELRLEAEKLKKEIRNSRYGKTTEEKEEEEEEEEREQTEHGTKTEVVAEFRKEREKYKEMKRQQGKKGSSREAITLELLSKFQNRLRAAQTVSGTYSDDDEEEEEEMEEELKEEEVAAAAVDDISDLSWLRHKLHFVEPDKKVLDANVHDVDRYELFDPRNPLNKRRREVSKQALKEK